MAESAQDQHRRQVLASIATQIGQGEIAFPTSAQLALRVRAALDDPDCGVETIARLIRADPLLAARTVALANSALFSRGGRILTDIPGAIARLGFAVVRSLATAVVARQIAGAASLPAHRDLALRLWEHTTHMAALAYVLARRVTRQDPDTALFAGLVHEVGGFYLISRAAEFPGLLDAGLMGTWADEGDAEVDPEDDRPRPSFESRIGRAILEALNVPTRIIEAVEVLWQGYLSLPPESLGDTLLLANQLAPVASPLDAADAGSSRRPAVSIDMVVGDEMLTDILNEASGEVNALAAVLRG